MQEEKKKNITIKEMYHFFLCKGQKCSQEFSLMLYLIQVSLDALLLYLNVDQMDVQSRSWIILMGSFIYGSTILYTPAEFVFVGWMCVEIGFFISFNVVEILCLFFKAFCVTLWIVQRV